MQIPVAKPFYKQMGSKARKCRGFTLIELIAAISILLALSFLAIPLERVNIKR